MTGMWPSRIMRLPAHSIENGSSYCIASASFLEGDLREKLANGFYARTLPLRPDQTQRQRILIGDVRGVFCAYHTARKSLPKLGITHPRSMRGRIDDRPARLNDSAGSKASGLQAALPHDMENSLPPGDKIISDYTAVASPPRGFRTHDCAAPFTPLIEQEPEASTKLHRERIVGIVMKALVRPEIVDILR